MRKALLETPAADPALLKDARTLDSTMKDLREALDGDATVAARQEPTAPGILARLGEVTGSIWGTTQLPTNTQRQNLAWAESGLKDLETGLEKALATLSGLETALDAAKAPFTPGRTLR